MKRMTAAACMAALCGACDTGQNAQATNVAATTSGQAAAPTGAAPAGTGQARSMVIGGVATCQPTGEVRRPRLALDRDRRR
jgi:hypothetical protein